MKQRDIYANGKTGKTENFLLLGILLFSLWGAYHLFFQSGKAVDDHSLPKIEVAAKSD